MKKLIATVLASAALLSIGTSYAHADDDTNQYQIRVQPTATYKLAPQEFSVYADRYQLNTGDKLQLRQTLSHYYAKLNHGTEVEIYPQQPGVFVASTGTRLEFSNDGDDLLMINAGTLPGASAALAGQPDGSKQMAAR